MGLGWCGVRRWQDMRCFVDRACVRCRCWLSAARCEIRRVILDRQMAMRRHLALVTRGTSAECCKRNEAACTKKDKSGQRITTRRPGTRGSAKESTDLTVRSLP
jgi:hypothetical protein